MAELLEAIKKHLGITGKDEDAALTAIITDGIAYIDELSGLPNEYASGRARAMLMDYCQLVYGNEFVAAAYLAAHGDDLLLLAVRNYLDITWPDDAGDKKLAGIISRGIKYIDRIAGQAMDYSIDDKPRELLFDYCRYVRSGALDVFQVNYRHELLALQIDQEVAAYAAENPDI